MSREEVAGLSAEIEVRNSGSEEVSSLSAELVGKREEVDRLTAELQGLWIKAERMAAELGVSREQVRCHILCLLHASE